MATSKKLKLPESPIDKFYKPPVTTPAAPPAAVPDANIKQGAFTPTPIQKSPKGIKYDTATGQPSGFTYPDGRTITGLSSKEIEFLDRKYSGYKLPQVGELTHEQEVIAKEKQRLADAKTIADMTPPNLDPIQAADIGKIDINEANNFTDPLSLDISTNLNAYKNGLDYTAGLPNTNPLSNTVINKLGKVIDPISSLIPFGIGKAFVNAISEDRKWRDYVNDYSNENTLVSIRKDIRTADEMIISAIANAKITENNPENVRRTKEVYNFAMTLKFKKIAQLKAIADNDQREYTDSIKDDLTGLDVYFNKGGKQDDDDALFAALNKPTPKYINAGVQ